MTACAIFMDAGEGIGQLLQTVLHDKDTFHIL